MLTKSLDTMNRVIEKLIQEELRQSKLKYWDAFHSTHEGHGLIKEEFEETKDELEWCEIELNEMLADIKNNKKTDLAPFKEYTRDLIREAIQLAAMVDKYEQSFKKELEDEYYMGVD